MVFCKAFYCLLNLPGGTLHRLVPQWVFGPIFFTPSFMEKTLSVFVESLSETWEMGDDMAIKLNEYYKEHPLNATNADEVHRAWYGTLSHAEQAQIKKRAADSSAS